MRLQIYGLAAIQDALLKIADAVSPRGLRPSIAYGGKRALAQARADTHETTGTLEAAHDVRYEAGGARAVLYVRPLINPKSKQPATAYAGLEHARGGAHDFYRNVDGRIAIDVLQDITKRLP